MSTVNKLFSAINKNLSVGIVPIDGSRLAEQPDMHYLTEKFSQNENNGLTVSKNIRFPIYCKIFFNVNDFLAV